MAQKKKRKQYTKEFKMDVIQQSYRCDNIRQLGNELGLAPALIYKWRGVYEDKEEIAFPGKGNQALTLEQQQVHRLELENRELRTERDILKKAIGIFGKTNG